MTQTNKENLWIHAGSLSLDSAAMKTGNTGYQWFRVKLMGHPAAHLLGAWDCGLWGLGNDTGQGHDGSSPGLVD